MGVVSQLDARVRQLHRDSQLPWRRRKYGPDSFRRMARIFNPRSSSGTI